MIFMNYQDYEDVLWHPSMYYVSMYFTNKNCLNNLLGTFLGTVLVKDYW